MSAVENLRAGDTVRILTGMAGGRLGEVRAVRRTGVGQVVDVAVELPVLLTRPDGSSQVVVLPYAPLELQLVGAWQ
jgi:hypothetical protein